MERSNFTDIIVLENGLDLKEWVFCPGMIFNAMQKWWGDRGEREKAHEALDLLLYRDNDGRILSLDESTKVPAIYDGTVIKVIDDFLGRSIFIKHDNNFFTAFGHTQPLAGITEGTKVKERDVIANIAAFRTPNINLQPHLHITVGQITGALPFEALNWDIIGASEMMTLTDPLKVIGGNFSQLEISSTECSDL